MQVRKSYHSDYSYIRCLCRSPAAGLESQPALDEVYGKRLWQNRCPLFFRPTEPFFIPSRLIGSAESFKFYRIVTEFPLRDIMLPTKIGFWQAAFLSEFDDAFPISFCDMTLLTTLTFSIIIDRTKNLGCSLRAKRGENIGSQKTNRHAGIPIGFVQNTPSISLLSFPCAWVNNAAKFARRYSRMLFEKT